MTIEKVGKSDVWVKIVPKNSQLDNLMLLKDYVESNPIKLHTGDYEKYPFNDFVSYRTNKVHKYDILGDWRLLNKNFNDKGGYLIINGKAQFIVDEEKIIIRPSHFACKESIENRELVADNFLDYLIENNIDISND